jgi:two-component system, cell cycle sensor histidine kinase and response regulator CckA
MTAAERTPVAGVSPDDHLRVLVVEDDESIRRMICRRLRQAGLEVLSAASGEEALALCHESAPPVHLLVTDGIMPGMDGFELARQFAQRARPVRTILISGFMGHFMARSDIPENVEAFFPKPFSGEELVAKVLDVLGAAA